MSRQVLLFAINEYLVAGDVDIDDIVLRGDFVYIEYSSCIEFLLDFFLEGWLYKNSIVVHARKFSDNQLAVGVVLEGHGVLLGTALTAPNIQLCDVKSIK